MTLSSGFFNSGSGANAGDRPYSAEDFSNYLRGIVGNGFLNLDPTIPGFVGFQVLNHSDPVGAPLVDINLGKAYLNGLWCINTTKIAHQIAAGTKNVVYLCFDTVARNATIGHVSGSSPVTPADDALNGKYYLGLALVANPSGGGQPQQTDISDLRDKAGLLAATINTGGSISPGIIGLSHLDNTLIQNTNGVMKFLIPLADGLMAASMLADNSIGLEKMRDTTIIPSVVVGAVSFAGTEKLLGTSTTPSAPGNTLLYTPVTNSIMRADCVVTFDATTASDDRTVHIRLKWRSKIAGQTNFPTTWTQFADEGITVPHDSGGRYLSRSVFGDFPMTAGNDYEVGIFVIVTSTNKDMLATNHGRIGAMVGPM